MINFIKGKFSNLNKNVFSLIFGTTVSQAIPVLASFALVRLYVPEDFGLYAIYFSISVPLSILITLRYELAIILPDKDSTAYLIVIYSIIISFLFSIILTVLIFVISYVFPQFFPQSIYGWVFFLPISIFFSALLQCLSLWSNRLCSYKFLSISRVAQTFFSAIISLSLGYFDFHSKGLVFGHISGLIIACLFLYLFHKKSLGKYFFLIKKFNFQTSFKILNKYNNFPKYLLPAHLINSIYSQLPIYLFSLFYNINIVGFFSLAQRTIRLPTAVIANSFGEVFRQKASEHAVRDESIKNIFRATLKKVLFIGFVPFLLIILFAPSLFEIIFGHEWRMSGSFVQILAIMYFVQFIATPFNSIYMIKNKQSRELLLNTIFILSNLSIILICAYLKTSFTIMLCFYSLVNAFIYLSYLFTSYRYAKKT